MARQTAVTDTPEHPRKEPLTAGGTGTATTAVDGRTVWFWHEQRHRQPSGGHLAATGQTWTDVVLRCSYQISRPRRNVICNFPRAFAKPGLVYRWTSRGLYRRIWTNTVKESSAKLFPSAICLCGQRWGELMEGALTSQVASFRERQVWKYWYIKLVLLQLLLSKQGSHYK